MSGLILKRQVIYGLVPSKSNSYRVITLHGHGSLCKTSKCRKYEESFFMQCDMRGLNIATRFRLDMSVYFSSDRPDLDNACKIVLDCLQACEAIKNDRLCSEIIARKFVDKNHPRVEFEITQLIANPTPDVDNAQS